MSWRDNLYDASFRQIPFKVADATTEVGRRNVLHQYPFKDVPYLEDIGLDADTFRLQAYIVQNSANQYNYFSERDALLKALKQSGPGILVHPFLGTKTVGVLGKAVLTESFGEGGIARFSITFVIAGENKFPLQDSDPIGATENAANQGITSILDSVISKISVDGLPGYSIDGQETDMTRQMDMVKRLTKAVKGVPASRISGSLADLAVLRSGVSDAVNTPTGIANSLNTSFDSLLNLVGMTDNTRLTSSIDNTLGVSTTKSFLSVTRYGEITGEESVNAFGGQLTPLEIRTEVTAQQSANRVHSTNMTRAIAIINACKVAVNTDYLSTDQALGILVDIVEELDAQLLKYGNEVTNEEYEEYNISVTDYESHQALESMRPVFVESMNEIASDLASLENYDVPPGVQSSLEVSYDKYNDLDRESDIFKRTRNQSDHPGFLPSGDTIRLLSE